MFTFEKMDDIRGKIDFYKLKVDGSILLDNFVEKITTNPRYKKEYLNILSWMEHYSNNKLVGREKFRTLDNKKEPYTLFEFKSDHLRVYGMGRTGGEVIIFGGYKNHQKKDVKWLRVVAKDIYKQQIQI